MAARLATQLARPDLPARTRRVMRFAAAKIRGGPWRCRGGDRPSRPAPTGLMAEAFPYSFEADLATRAGELAGDWPRLRDLTPKGPEDPVVFVTGLPRSGTTLVETILAAHPDVHRAGVRCPYLSRALSPPPLRPPLPLRWRRCARTMQTRCASSKPVSVYLAAARRRKRMRQGSSPTRPFPPSRGSAMPPPRCLARVSWCCGRDPRDTGLSLWRNMFSRGPSPLRL